jgi:internalin A
LAGLSDLRTLYLPGTSLDGSGLRYLAHLQLLSLNLNYTGVADDHLAHLAGMTSLTQLFLDETRVTDAGIEHLMGLSNLKSLHLDHAPLTEGAVARLESLPSLPHLQVYSDRITPDAAKSIRKTHPAWAVFSAGEVVRKRLTPGR